MKKREVEKLTDLELVKELKQRLKKRPVIKLKEYFSNPEIDVFLEELYRRYQTPIRNFCSKIIFDKDSLDDIFHEVFINIYLNIHRFKMKKSVKSWIYKISHNVAINFINKRHHKEKLILNKKLMKNKSNSMEMLEMLLEDKEDIEQHMFKRELKSKVLKAFEQLPPDMKAIYILHEELNFTFDDIADIIRLSSRQVKTKYKKLILFMRNELQKDQITTKYLD
ncbi:RNA polymerase sigma factor [Spirochaetota bacterium]